MASALVILLLAGGESEAAAPARWTLKTKVDGKWIEGKLLKWSDDEVHVIGRDGYLWSFDPTKASDSTNVSSDFRPLTYAEMRGRLMREFGERYEVSGTGHYLVVHPAGQRDVWAPRFEELYRSFGHYFSVRGLAIERPEFPLVAIVVPKAEDLYRYSAGEGTPVGPGMLGYYSRISNRIILYDQADGAASAKVAAKAWLENYATIVHEATHQMAFNTGVHGRASLPPKWVVEGLGTLFEANGVSDSRSHTRLADRINRGRLDDFRKYVMPKLTPEVVAGFVASDKIYQANPGAAYATAWAMTFYLVETEPKKYTAYFARTARRPAFEPYTDAQRMEDFTAVFGTDFRMFHARFVRFISELK